MTKVNLSVGARGFGKIISITTPLFLGTEAIRSGIKYYHSLGKNKIVARGLGSWESNMWLWFLVKNHMYE